MTSPSLPLKFYKTLTGFERRTTEGAIAFLIFCGFFLFGPISLRSVFFNWLDLGDARKVGAYTHTSGKAYRQGLNDPEFIPLQVNSSAFQNDVIATGDDGTAKIVLDSFAGSKGAVITIEKNSMIVLSFEILQKAHGVSRVAIVKVLAGNVFVTDSATNAATSKSSPEAAKQVSIQQVRPNDLGEIVEVKPDHRPLYLATNLLLPTKNQTFHGPGEVAMSWKISLPTSDAILKVYRIADKKREEVFNKFFSASNDGIFNHRFTPRPGIYEWEVAPSFTALYKDARPQASRFQVDARYEAIDLDTPKVAGRKETTSAVYHQQTSKNFNIELSWTPRAEDGSAQKSFRVSAKSVKGEVLFQDVVQGRSVKIRSGKPFNGEFIWSVEGSANAGGFIPISQSHRFKFTMKAPALTKPENDHQYSHQKILEGESVLLTWEKVNFTDRYFVEVATDARFKKSVSQFETERNYQVLNNLAPGVYYWRIKAVSGTQEISSVIRHFRIVAVPDSQNQ